VDDYGQEWRPSNPPIQPAQSLVRHPGDRASDIDLEGQTIYQGDLGDGDSHHTEPDNLPLEFVDRAVSAEDNISL
jgi:hypothetical protein